MLGVNLFVAFPSDPNSESGRMLRMSLERTAATAEVDHLPLIPYPIQLPDKTFEDRFWSASHIPVRCEDGRLLILQHTVDVTELQRLRRLAQGRDLQVESDLLSRAGAIADRNLALSREGEYLRMLFAQAPSFMAVLQGPQHVFDLANEAYLDIVGRRELQGKTVREALPEVVDQGFIEILDAVYETGEPYIARAAPVILNRGPSGAGELRHLDFIYQPIKSKSGTVQGIFVQGHDVTDQRVAQASLQELAATLESRVSERTRELEDMQRVLRQSQKMEAVGSLAGGIAHDFNNLLQVITGSLQMALRETGDHALGRHLDNAMSATRRGAQLASQLLSFGRRQPLEPKAVNLGRLLENLESLLHRAIGEAVEVETIVPDHLWNTLADPTQVETALLNLAINARDAMEGSGRLVIEVGNVILDEEYARRAVDIVAGDYVMLSVSDTGHGMPPEILEKVFEPFFSTKPEGKGTGLGLSMVYGFARQSGGHVSIHSEVGSGTSVRIYLPRADAAEDREPEIGAGFAGGNETVLVVEDDDAVRDTVAAMLADLGYKVLLARDAQSGFAIVDSGAHVDVLFTDVVMPGTLKSTDLADHLAQARAGTPVIFTSGYAENAIVHDGRLDSGLNFLAKPYTREQLARKLRQVLDRKDPVVDATPSVPARKAIRTALLCEDEPLIRMLTTDMLEDFGLRVVETGSLKEALGALDDAIDVLVTDLRLPDGSGIDLVTAARERFGDLPVVIASGDRLTLELTRAATITKPYDAAALKAAIGQVGDID
ncbi:MAG: response regulator [Pseudomonas sp.]